MWTCKSCESEVDDDSWESCWNCGCPKDYTSSEYSAEIAKEKKMKSIPCLRCEVPMIYGGKKKFHEGTRAWAFFLGDLGELFVNREEYKIYGCPKCGKIEFFGELKEERFQPDL